MPSVPDPNDLRCRELVELVTDYLENALPGETRTRFEDHLATCKPCLIYVEQIRLTIRTVGRVSEQHLSPAKKEEMLDVFRGWRQVG